MGKHLALKTWSGPVRTAYFRALRAGLSGHFSANAEMAKPALKSLAKALGATQQIANLVRNKKKKLFN